MSLVHELEDSVVSETNHAIGEYNETWPKMAPFFVKPNMNRVVTKPAGSSVLLSCPAEGSYVFLLLKDASVALK